MDFVASQPLTVGVELELQLLDADGLDLVDGIMPLIELYPGSPYIKPEFIQNTVEVTSSIGQNVAQVHAHLNQIACGLEQSCNKLGMAICGAGTHPFCKRLALITPLPRYRQMEKSTGYLGHNQITYATHVHVGMTSADDMIRVMHRLKPYLPMLIALSASSPFWRGYETGFVAYRHRILAASQSYGIPPSFRGWQQFCAFMGAASHAQVIETIHDIHWDIRPRPHLGTIEVRVMDAQPTITDAMCLAALVRTLAAFLLQQGAETPGLPMALPWWQEKNNHYQASHSGIKANYIYRPDGETRPLSRICNDVIRTLEPTAQALGERHYLNHISARLRHRDLGYCRQQDVYRQTGSLQQVVAALVQEFSEDLSAAHPDNARIID